MKKYIYLLSLFLLTMFTVSAQIGINTETANTSAALDVFSESKGVLFPRMTTNDRNIHLSVAAPGLMFYNTTENCLNINVGTRNSPEWACLEDSCPILPPGPEPTGKRVRWGALNTKGVTLALAGHKTSGQTLNQYSRAVLFINSNKFFNQSAINGYKRFDFSENSFYDVEKEDMENDADYFINRFDVMSIAPDVNGHWFKEKWYASMKKFSEAEGKALFITLEGLGIPDPNKPISTYDTYVLEYFGISSNNVFSVKSSLVKTVVHQGAKFSPNENFGPIVIGSRLTTQSPQTTLVPIVNLPDNAIVYLIDSNTGHAVAFSVGNKFFISGKGFHEGSILHTAGTDYVNAFLFLRKYVAAFLDHVVIP